MRPNPSAGSDDCRALVISGHGSEADYFCRQTGDSVNIIPTKVAPEWSKAMHDAQWHHVAVRWHSYPSR
jgi:hypothetical protein